MVKNLPANAGDVILIPESEDPLEEEMATNSSILAWKIPWTREPTGLLSKVSRRVRHDLVTAWTRNIVCVFTSPLKDFSGFFHCAASEAGPWFFF